MSRLGLPLVNEAVIGYQDKDFYNRTHPKDDVANFGAYFLNPIVVRDAEAVGIYAALGVDPTPFKSNRTDILDVINLKDIPTAGAHRIPLSATGDVLRVDLAATRRSERPAAPARHEPGAGGRDRRPPLPTPHRAERAHLGRRRQQRRDVLDRVPVPRAAVAGAGSGHGKPTP